MKTKFFFLFCILYFFNINAQIINFEDTEFKNYLLRSYYTAIAYNAAGAQINIDANKDNEIDVTEAQKVAKLFVYPGFPNTVKSLKGIEFFSNLKEFKGGSFKLDTIDFSNLTSLQVVNIYSSTYNNLILSNCKELSELLLNGSHNTLSSLDLSTNNKLTRLIIPGHQIEGLDLTQKSELIELDCSLNQLKSLDLSGCKKLKTVNASNNLLSSVNTTGLLYLTDLDLGNNISPASMNSISSIDVSTNSSLNKLNIQGNPIVKLDVSNLSKLNQLLVSNCNSLEELLAKNCIKLLSFIIPTQSLKKLDLENCSSIDSVNLESYTGNPSLEYCNINNCVSLKYLKIAGKNLSTFNYNNIPKLETAYFYFLTNNLVSFSFVNFQNLQNLAFSKIHNSNPIIVNNNPLLASISFNDDPGNNLQPNLIELKNNPNLKDLSIYYWKDLTSIDVSGSVKFLQSLAIESTGLKSFILDGAETINQINIENNSIENISFKNCFALKNAFLRGNKISKFYLDETYALNNLELIWLDNNLIDDFFVKNLSSLKTIYINNNLPLKKFYTFGLPQLSSVSLSDNINLEEISFKDGVSNTIAVSAYNDSKIKYICKDNFDNLGSLKTTEYCTYYPGGYENNYTGKIKLDLNNNGCDDNDIPLANMKISYLVNGVKYYTFTNELGNYIVYSPETTALITPETEYQYYISQPVFANISTGSSQNFCIVQNGTHNDLEVQLAPVDLARPGFEATYRFVYLNKGNTTLSGSLNLDYQGRKMSFVSSELTPDTNINSNLVWNFTDLKPFEQKSFIVTFRLNAPTHPTDPLNSGDKLTFTAKIFPINNDETPKDNNLVLHQTVVNSQDPNDKTCLEGDVITPDLVGNDVHYLIRFENVGTANAVNVVVKDMIDTAKFDVESLQPIKTSHSYRMTITEGNKVEFFFENIQLPYDDANNDGYILFKIKTKPTLVVGDTFSNKADIYFDYNFPIVTNDAVTTVQNVLSTQEFSKSEISIYPNPVKDILTFKTSEKIKKAEIYDLNGRLIKVELGISNNQMNVSALKTGTYVIKVVSDKKYHQTKFIKQ